MKKSASLLLAALLSTSCFVVRGTAFASQAQPDFVLQAKSNTVLPANIARLETKAQQSQAGEAQVELALAYLQLARQPGWSRYFDKAQQLLNSSGLPASVPYWLALADSAQQQHQFQTALQHLAKIQAKEPGNINALLMAQRIHLVQNNLSAAQQQCTKLVGQQELFLLSLCSLEVAGRQGKTKDSYKALQLLARQWQTLPLPQQQWLVAVLAEQAEILQQPQQARAWLEQLLFQSDTSGSPLPLWVKWADLTLPDHPELVYQRLQRLHQRHALEDSLLLRLALAEQQQQAQTQYQQLMQQRVLLREQRQDTLHSADLAHYYLRLEPNAVKALYYARLNFQQAQEPDDQSLLTQALELSTQASRSSSPLGDHP
jgi:hypothetical protein